MTLFRHVPTVLLAGLAASCQSTSTEPQVRNDQVMISEELDQLEQQGVTFSELNRLGDDLEERTDLSVISQSSELPTTGATQYLGTLAIGGSEQEFNILSMLEMNIEFSDDTINGSLYHIVDKDHGVSQQVVLMENGEIYRQANVDEAFLYDGQFSGDITFASGASTALDIQIFGDFYNSLDAAAGIATGSYTTETGEVVHFPTGVFVSEVVQ